MSEEMIEVFTEQNERLGVRLRREVHSLGLWHRGVHGFLFNAKGQLLIQRRAKDCDTFPDTFDCSISEHLSVGESFEEAFIRGCSEELGVVPVALKKLVSYKMHYGPTDNMICELFSAQVLESELHIDESEVAGVEFLELVEVLRRLESDPSQFTSWFREHLLWFEAKPHKLSII